MQCDDFETRLQSLLDDRQPPERDASLQAHAAWCERCGQLLRTQEGLMRALRSVPVHPSEDFSRRVIAEAKVGRASANQRPWALVPAALVALAASWLIFMSGPTAQNTSSTPISAEPRVAEQIRPSNSGSELPQLVLSEGALSQEEQLDESLVALGSAVQEIFNRFSEAPFDELQSVDRITGGFRPIATTLNVAFDALRRTLPGQAPHEQS